MFFPYNHSNFVSSQQQHQQHQQKQHNTVHHTHSLHCLEVPTEGAPFAPVHGGYNVPAVLDVSLAHNNGLKRTNKVSALNVSYVDDDAYNGGEIAYGYVCQVILNYYNKL